MINKQQVLKSVLNKEDKMLFSKIIDQLISCIKNYEPTFTDFIPISKYGEFLNIIKNQHISINIMAFGGFEEAERIIIGFFPEFLEPNFDYFPISVLEITYNEKYSRILAHRDFLGSLIGLGIERTKMGDIIIKDNKAICFLNKEISDYININMEKVGSTKVKIKSCNIKEYDIPKPNFEEKNIIVPSLRLDATLSGAFNISRGKISDLIKAEKVFINFVVESNPAKNIKENDIITLRGTGRIKILGIVGKTKKDRMVINILKYI